MAASPKDLLIEQGATFFLGFNWHRAGPEDTETGEPTVGDPYDLADCTARMQIRRKQGDPVLVQATSDPPTTPEAIANGAGRIKLEPDRDGPPTGRIEITLTDEDTDLLSSRTCSYDLEIVWPLQPGELRPRVDRLLKGVISTDPNITQVQPQDPTVID
jgi:hypothetical protein